MKIRYSETLMCMLVVFVISPIIFGIAVVYFAIESYLSSKWSPTYYFAWSKSKEVTIGD